MSEHTPDSPPKSKLTAIEREKVRAAIRSQGEPAVRIATGLGREALGRALAGLKVRRGTVMSIRLGLGSLEGAAPLVARQEGAGE